ncbi:unnamed protein product [Nyctereutes procyonoides]|uniref:(raccoon dog) hypothetical protein n=1 Tax=Nyctereutes procyonoides TaxID=34880 RepID=A0A811YH00_NYCPR|nr:unnamed protein product [Nyctereutes procyonoides]
MCGEEKTCNGLKALDTMDVKLMSFDGHELIVEREDSAENKTTEVNFREIPSCMLSKVHCLGFSLLLCPYQPSHLKQTNKQTRHMYFTYKVCYTNSSMEYAKCT